MALNPSIKFKDEAADVVWAAICTLEERAQHEVLAALGERIAFPDERATAHEIRVARGVAALREAAALAGHSPSVSEYRRLRDENPERAWPDDSPIRQWLGGNWNDALAAAGLDALPDPIAHYPERGPELSDEECLAAIRECAGDLGVAINTLSFPRYLNWARSTAVRRRAGRRPQGQLPFDRFGGWRGAKAAAMGVENVELAGADGHGYRYTHEAVFAAADEIAARCGSPGVFPTQTQWHRVRRAVLAAEKAAGEPPRAFPSMKVVRSRFESWEAAAKAYEATRRQGDTAAEGEASQ